MNHHFSSKGFSTAFECIEYILQNTQESIHEDKISRFPEFVN